ncbi:MAG: WG repeat-containing protein [Candidatus Acidiferrales bacterium]
MRAAIVTTFLLLVVAACAMCQDAAAQSSQHPTSDGSATPTGQSDNANKGAAGTPCTFDFERGEVPDCVRENARGELFIASQYVKDLSFDKGSSRKNCDYCMDSQGLAAVLSPKEGWMYVNRKGKVVITGVPVMDNGADWFNDGLVRTVKNGKYGFANSKGQIVIPPIYDGAMNFEKGRAEVCNGCKSKCVSDCEYHYFAGGEWFQIDTKGNIVARLQPRN